MQNIKRPFEPTGAKWIYEVMCFAASGVLERSDWAGRAHHGLGIQQVSNFIILFVRDEAHHWSGIFKVPLNVVGSILSGIKLIILKLIQ